MSRYYNKDELKEQLTTEMVYDLMERLGGNPTMKGDAIISDTICHNHPDEGSHKLYFYPNTKLCRCYSGCADSTFDVFDLVRKANKIQNNRDMELWDAMDYVASMFGIDGVEQEEETNNSKDWLMFKRHQFEAATPKPTPILPEFDDTILSRFSYPRIAGWEKEGILPDVSRRNHIGYYAGGEQITIPHYDINGRFIGLRGRALASDEADKYGKYRPLKINNIQYSHPLSMNLYHLNVSREAIERVHAAVVFESEKSCLQMESFYGPEYSIGVACCGSNLSSFQVQLLRDIGVQEIILAFDRQFKEIGDNEFKMLKKKLIHLNKVYGRFIKVSCIFDKNMITPYKASPSDLGVDIFEKLLKERFIPS